MASRDEFEIVRNFTKILDLPNRTDGTRYIYKPVKGMATKPDGYYYYEGITFILDAKNEGGKFVGQLEDYMRLEKNPNFIGFKYNGVNFECYVNGTLKADELEPKDKDYYNEKYFNKKINNESIVKKSAIKLANLFRNSGIDKQYNVPFIGSALLCMKYHEDIDTSSTASVINSIRIGIGKILKDSTTSRRKKKEFLQKILAEPDLQKARSADIFSILREISTIYNFINVSLDDARGHDIMNRFLCMFRKWNSVDANDKGEVFTPDHIARLMYKLAGCSKDNIILDPACGSGTFLTNAMSAMLTESSGHAESRLIQQTHLFGIEKGSFNSTLATMNMMMHGNEADTITDGDCFNVLPTLNGLYDRVLMNPPFAISDKELKFVEHALKYIKKDGIVAAIVPKSCLKGSAGEEVAYLRRIFAKNRLVAVVSLPPELFAPNAGVGTAIVIFQATHAPHVGSTLLIDCSDDGFVLHKEQGRLDTGRWPDIERAVLDAMAGKADELRVINKELSCDMELLFEAYSSPRTYDIKKDTFERYLREYVASQVLCGKKLLPKKISCQPLPEPLFAKFYIAELIHGLGKGKTDSPDRKNEDKYDPSGLPVIIAKKDNNGIGGTTSAPQQIYENKFCLIAGGNGGGGKTYYCNFRFAATSFVLVCDLFPQYECDDYARFYLAIVISERLFKTVSFSRTINCVPENIDIKLPATSKKEPDFNYMSNFIKQLPFAEYI